MEHILVSIHRHTEHYMSEWTDWCSKHCRRTCILWPGVSPSTGSLQRCPTWCPAGRGWSLSPCWRRWTLQSGTHLCKEDILWAQSFSCCLVYFVWFRVPLCYISKLHTSVIWCMRNKNVSTQVTACWGSGVHSHNDSMSELEGQGGRPVVQVYTHTTITAAGS